MVFCISALFAYVGSRASFLEPLGSLLVAFSLHVGSKLASWTAFGLPSRPLGGPFGLQVGLLEVLGPPSWLPWPPGPPSWSPGSALGLQVGLLGRILASKLASWASLGLQVGLLVWLLASKLASGSVFEPLASWAAFVNRPFEFKFFNHIYLRGLAECAERLNPPPPTKEGAGRAKPLIRNCPDLT